MVKNLFSGNSHENDASDSYQSKTDAVKSKLPHLVVCTEILQRLTFGNTARTLKIGTPNIITVIVLKFQQFGFIQQ